MGTEMKRGSGVASFLSSVESKKEQYNKVPQQSNPNIESWYDGTTAGARLINDVDTNKESSSNIAYLLESALQGAKNSGYGIANTFNEMNKYYDPTMNLDNLNAMADFVANTEQRVEGVKKVRDDLYKAQDSSNQAFNEKYADKQGAIKLAGDVAQGVGGMIPNIAANMLVPGAGMATMFASATGNKYKEAIQDGATDNQALLSGVLSGGVEVATEKLFDGISALGKGLGLEKKITNWLGKRITGPATKQVLEKVIGTLGEGAEEAISEYANAYITKIYNDNGKDALETFIDTTPDALYSAMIGAITSGVLEGGTNVVSNGAKSFLNKVESAKTQNINSNQPNLADTEQLQQSNVVSGINPNIAQIDSNKPTYNFGTVTKQDIQNLNDLTSKSNTKLEWFEGANDVNGYYQNGTIYLNKNKTSSDNYTTVMVHELSHHLENSGNYEAFKSVVFNNIRQNGLNLDNIRQGIARDYSNHIENLTEDDIDREVVAKFAEEYLFKDQEAINRLARTDRNLFQKIYDWIKDTIQYVTSNAEKQKLMDIERMYAKALNDVQGVNDNTSYSFGKSLSNANNLVQLDSGDYAVQLNVNLNNSRTQYQDIVNGLRALAKTKIKTVDGMEIYIPVEFGGELLHGSNMQDLQNKNNYKSIKAKKNIYKDVNDIVTNSKYNSQAPNNPPSKLSLMMGVSDFVYRDAYVVDSRGVVYEMNVNVGICNNPGKYTGLNVLYDIVNPIVSTKKALGRYAATSAAAANNANALQQAPNANPSLTPPTSSVKHSIGSGLSSYDSNNRELSKEQQEYFKDSKVRDANGNLKPVYHGTNRADRVGNYFNPDRATSGPMAFFTDNYYVARNYSTHKKDTSLSREYTTEYDLFKVNGMSLDDYWDSLSFIQRSAINREGSNVGLDEDWESVVHELGASKNSFGGEYERILKTKFENNGIKALYEIFINGGTLARKDMGKFKDVLEMVGIDNVEYFDPYKQDPKVYETYLNITNPFITSEISEDMIKQFHEAAKNAKVGEMYSADTFDKTNIIPFDWIEKLDADIKDGTTHVWTSIPDWVTNVLKENGYDGIQDTGGKKGGDLHTVYIPFYSNQIKSIENTAPTENEDIRYSIGGKLSNYDTENRQLSKEQQEYFKDSKVRDENGNLKVMYHGTENVGFTVFDNQYSDDGLSFFFTDSPSLASGYSGTMDNYIHPKFDTLEDLNQILNDANLFPKHKVINENGVYKLYKMWNGLYNKQNEVIEEFEDFYDMATFINEDYYSKPDGANYQVYLNIKNPLIVEGKGKNWDELQEINPYEADSYNYIYVTNGMDGKYNVEYENEFNEYGEAESKEMTFDEIKAYFGDYVASGVMNGRQDFEKLAVNKQTRELIPTNTRQYADYAHKNGYDGVIFKSIVDATPFNSKRDQLYPTTVAVAFNSNQIKFVDNTNPTTNDDIRYSRGKKLSEYDTKPSQLTQTDLNLANDLAKSFGIQDVSSLENNIRPIAQEFESTGRLSVESKNKLYRYVSNNTTGDELFNEMNKGKSDVRHYNFDQAINKYISNKMAEIDSNNYNAQAPIYEPNQGHRATFGNDTYETTPKVESLKMATEKTAKVKDYEKAAKNKLLKYLANQFNMTMYQANNVVGDFIDRAGMQIQTKNKVDSYLVRDIFNKMADNSYTLDDYMNKDFKPLVDYLKSTKIKLDENVLDGQSLKDFRYIKREYKDMLHFSNDGTSIDDINDHLKKHYASFLDDNDVEKNTLGYLKKAVEEIRVHEVRRNKQYQSDEVMREGDFIAFNEAYNNFLDSMRNAQNVANEIAAKKELKDSFDYNFYKEQQSKISKLKREYEKVQRKIVLDNKGTHFLNGLMSGAITTDDIDVEYRNDVLSMYRVKKPYEDAKNITKTYQSIYKQGLRDTAKGLISSIEGWQVHKKLNGLSFEMDTAERTIRDIAGDDAEPIIKEYFTPIHSNEAEATRFKNKWKAKLKALNLSEEEAAAVQMLGERADIGGREYTEADVVEAGLDLEKITNAVNEFKQMYNELYDQVNEVLVRNGYAAIEFRKDYFPHFIDAEPNTKLGKVLKKFGLNIAQDDLNADIAGLTEHFRPGKTWFGHAMHRTSNLTKYNALEGADRYLDGIANVIYHTDDIQKLRALDTEIRYQASDDGFKAAIDEIYDDENLFEEERQSKLQELYEKQGKVSTFGNLTTWLTNYTNNLANKKSAADRQMEYDLGRGMYTISKQLEGRVAANMVAASASSAMSNFIPITQALGECKATDIVKAMSQTMSTNFKNDGFVDESVFLTNRKGTDKLVKTKLQDLSDSLSIPFEMVDNFVSSTIVRAKYLGNLDKGMTHEQAMQDADSYAASLMADRSKGAMPLVFERKNPVAKMFTMFQLEQNNQINYLLKDLPRAKKEEAATAILMDIMRMAIGAWCFNEINQLIFGRRSALDPIDMAYSSWKTMNNDSMNIIEKGAAIGTEIGQELPFIGGYLGGGRMPISSALPDWNSVTRLADEGYSLEDKVGIATQGIIKPLSYMVSPFGAGQAWKTYEGLKAYNEGGVYNITSSGKKLKYAVDDNIGNLFRAAIGGKSSFPEATEYYDSGRSPLSVKQTAAFEKASSLGADKEQLIEAMYRAKGIDSMKDSNGETIKLSKAAQIRKMLDEYDFTTSQKKALYESIGVSKSIADMTSLEFKQYVKENNIK